MSSKADTKLRTRAAKPPKHRPGPEGGKRDINRQKRTELLSKTALKLFLKRGIEAVTIDEIVDSAGVAKGSFYRYFADKGALVETIMTPFAVQMRRAVAGCESALEALGHDAPLAEPYQKFGLELAAIVLEMPDVVRLYLQECRTPESGRRKPIRALANEIFEGATALSEFARSRKLTKPVDPRIPAAVVAGAVEFILYRMLSGETFGDPLKIPIAVIDLMLDGVRLERQTSA